MDQVQYIGPPSDASLKDIAAIAWRRKWIILLVVAASLGVTYYLHSRMKPLYRATAQMILTQPKQAAGNSPESSIAAPLVESPETQEEMIASDRMAQLTLAWLKNEALERKTTLADMGFPNEEDILRKFPQVVSVSIPKNTNLIEVTVTSHSPEQTSTLANAICKAFVAWKKDIARASLLESIQSMEIRARRAQRVLLAAEKRETQFKQRHRLVDVPTEQTATLNQYLQRDSEVKTLKQDQAAQNAKLRKLGTLLAEADTAIRSGEFVRNDAQVMDLQAQLEKLEIERANRALVIRPGFPGPDSLENLDARIQTIRERLTKQIQSTLDNKRPSLQAQGTLFEQFKQAQTDVVLTNAKLKAAATVRDQLKRATASLPATSLMHARLARDVELARKSYDALQVELNMRRTAVDTIGGNVQITSPAFPPSSPFEPNLQKNMLVGGLIGVGLACACALLFEHSDRRLRTVKDVRRMVGGPIIGTLPRMSRRQMRRLARGEASPPTLEAYGLARANLALAVRNAGQHDPWHRQVILITSAIPGEGKSITAAAMARSIARSGKSVILVDADMRRPAQNHIFNTAEPHGLADVLTGEMTLDEALVASDTENLSILHSGDPPRNPTELISLPQMAETISLLRSEADVVVVDAPACSSVADALLIAPHVDCILYVIGAGQAREEIVQDTTAALSAAAPKTMVYFVNRAPKDRGSHGYKYYYSYTRSKQHRRSYEQERLLTEGESDVRPEDAAPQGETGVVTEDRPTAPFGTGTLILEGKGTRLIGFEGPCAGQSFALNGAYITVGRKPENNIVLSQDSTVSRYHAHLAEENGRYVLYDDGSANGTFVNDAQISRQMLIPGDIVQFGSSKFRYE